MAKAQTKEVAVIEKLEELKDYATQAQNPYLLGRINRIMQEVKTDGIAKGQEKEWKKGITEKNYIGDYHEEDVHEVATAKIDSFVERMIPIVDQQNLIDLKNAQNELLKEVTWESIFEEWNLVSNKYPYAFDWLSENYNVPNRKL